MDLSGSFGWGGRGRGLPRNPFLLSLTQPMGQRHVGERWSSPQNPTPGAPNPLTKNKLEKQLPEGLTKGRTLDPHPVGFALPPTLLSLLSLVSLCE